MPSKCLTTCMSNMLIQWKLSQVDTLGTCGHPRDAKMVPVTGAGRLRECKNTKFVWELRKTAFCEDDRK